MKYRKLRIAWSVTWGAVAVLLCVLWVRSYWLMDNMYGFTSWSEIAHFGSIQGQFVYRRYYSTGGVGIQWTPRSESVADVAKYVQDGFPNGDEFYIYRHRSRFGFGQLPDGFFMPLSLPMLLAAVLTIAPWLNQFPYRFSLRTLLIATTLVAVGLGAIIWITK